MKTIALHKAKEHLSLAKGAAGKLTLDNGFKAYEQAWSEFLSQVSRFYSKMEQGAKGCGKSQAWFGRKKCERRKDALLSYLHHARDCDEHGIDYVTQLRSDGSTIRFPETEEVSFKAWIKLNPDGSVDVREPSVSTPDGEFSNIEHQNPRVELVTVRDSRYGDSFDPPQTHQDKPIVFNTPETVASLAVAYLEKMFEEASKLPPHV